jgi:hypothetical protein
VARDKPLYFVGAIALYSLAAVQRTISKMLHKVYKVVAMYHIIVEADDGSSPFRYEFHYGTRIRLDSVVLFRHKKLSEVSACQVSYGDLQLSAGSSL